MAIYTFGCSGKIESTSPTSDSFDKNGGKNEYLSYPHSFRDTNGDGNSDFNGIVAKLDYLESLGIDMVWMNPFFYSPLIDNGYDLKDYQAIHERYGTMADFDTMLAGMHDL